MSGNGTPNGPTNPPSLASETIYGAFDGQTYVAEDSYVHMFPDPLPGRITRIKRADNAGTIGEGQLDAAWPDFGRGYIPHQYIPRHPVSVTPFDKTIDVTVTIPGVFVADPLH